jgi:4-hydroxybenzoate polyprenyltransferase
LRQYLSLIKFSHTVFALPFALTGFTMAYKASNQPFQAITFLLVILCMVFARSAAMSFNRWLDRDIDAGNPRTATREIPAGVISPRSALVFVISNAFLFIATTWFINPLCFYLSPVALMVILGYSFTKRFTALCHLILGLGLALAPIGAYIAVTGSFALPPVFLGTSVLFWVAGFDVIYALQDQEFDASKGLHSIPARFGIKMSLRISEMMHITSAMVLGCALWLYAAGIPVLGILSVIGLFSFLVLLTYQHLIISYKDLSRVNLAFFTTNGVASILFAAFVITDILV